MYNKKNIGSEIDRVLGLYGVKYIMNRCDDYSLYELELSSSIESYIMVEDIVSLNHGDDIYVSLYSVMKGSPINFVSDFGFNGRDDVSLEKEIKSMIDSVNKATDGIELFEEKMMELEKIYNEYGMDMDMGELIDLVFLKKKK